MVTVGARFLPLVAILTTASCGDESGDDEVAGPACAEATCRGDVTGRWQVMGACWVASEAIEHDDCPDFGCTVDGAAATGSYDFRTDGGVSFSYETSFDMHCSVPKSCVTITACEELDTATRTCTDSGGACDCVDRGSDQGEREGDWSVEGGILAMSDANGSTVTSHWCAQGSSMGIHSSGSFDSDFGGTRLPPVPLVTMRLDLAADR